MNTTLCVALNCSPFDNAEFLMMNQADTALWNSYWTARSTLEILKVGTGDDPRIPQAAKLCLDRRAAILNRYLPKTRLEVMSITGLSHLPDGLEVPDAIGSVFVAITQRMDAFDGSVKFESFIMQRAAGQILDERRKQGFTPRAKVKLAKAQAFAQYAFYHQHGREPAPDELQALIGAVRVLRTPMMLQGDGPDRESSGGRERAGERFADPQTESEQTSDAERECLITAIVPGKIDREILRGYYFDNLSMREIGQVLGFSETRISQLHTKLLQRLRENPRAQQLICDHASR